jgi:hypothetical protein
MRRELRRFGQRNWVRRVLFDSGVILLILSLVGFVGFLAVPPLVRYLAEHQLEKTLGRRVHIERVRANVFALSMTLEGLQVYEADGTTPFAGFRRLYVNAELMSLLRHAPVLKDVQLEAPRVRVVRSPARGGKGGRGGADTYNFSDIVERMQGRAAGAPPQTDAPDEPPRFSLRNIRISDGELVLHDQRKQRTHSLADLQATIPFISTLPVYKDVAVQPGLRVKVDGAPVVVTGRSKPFKGSLETTAELRLSDFDLRRLAPYLPIPFDVEAGRVDAFLDVAFVRKRGRGEKEVPRLVVTGRTVVRQLDLARQGGAPLLALERLELDLREADVTGQRLAFERVRVAGLDVRARRGPAGLDLAPLFPYRAPREGGRDERGEKAHATGARVEPSLGIADLSLEAVTLRAGEDDVPLRLPQLQVRDLNVDVGRQRVSLGELGTRGGEVRLRRDATGALDWAALGGAGEAAAPEAQTPRPPTWTFGIEKTQVTDWRLQLDDASVNPPPRLAIGPVTIAVEALDTAPGKRAHVDLKLGAAGKGTVALAGSVAVTPPAAELDVRLRGVDLLPLQPYFAARISLLVTAGLLSTTGKLSYSEGGAGTAARVRYTGSVDLARFASLDGKRREPFLKWRSLHLGGLALDTQPLVVAIRGVALSDFFARLVISPEGHFNFEEVFAPPQAPPPAKPTPSQGRAPATGPPPNISVERITLQGGRVNFSDRYIKPNFSATLTQLGGRIAGLSSRASGRGEVDLRGAVDDSGQLSIVGQMNPLAADRFLDLRAEVANFELPPTSPYAVKYAGYGIDRGKLGLSLGYKIENRKLKASNHLTLEQLKLGEKVDSPTATKLPVKLAVKLLTDRNGVIDLDIPVEGSLDDPEFRIFWAVVKALGKLIAKAATAPFALITSAFGGSEELSRVEFPAGQVTLDAKGAEKIETLRKALHSRPSLAFELQGGADRDKDRAGLQRYVLEKKLRAQKAAELAHNNVAVPDPEKLKIEPGERDRLLGKVYDAESFPKPRNFIGLAKGLPPAEMEKLILTNVDTSDEALKGLAQKRAQVVREALVRDDPQSAGRLFIVAPRVAAGGDPPANRVDLHLKK